MPDYEVFLDRGNAPLVREITYPILDADFGDGFYGSALVGDANGVRKITLSWSKVHRDGQTIQPRTYNLVNIGSPVSRYKYAWDFIYRRLSAGNTPFWFADVDAKTGFRTVMMCRLIPFTVSFRQDGKNPLLYNYSFSFQQLRGAPAQS